MTTRYAETPENLRLLADALRAGEPVAVPSETVYGLAADALNDEACRAVFRAKGRPPEDPLIVHLPRDFDLTAVARPTRLLAPLRRSFWPGPLTLILEKTAAVPDVVTAGLPSVAVRMPAHPVFQALLAAFGGPLAAPSANPFAGISPTTAEHVEAGLGSRIRYILDGGPCRFGIESTILDIRDPDRPTLLRHGAIPVEELEAVLGQPIARPAPEENTARLAPGQLPRHYSPRTRLTVVPAGALENRPEAGDPDTALLFFRKPGAPPTDASRVFWLSESGSPREAAANLFATLHRIDARRFALILAESAPDDGFGRAINDRLNRAAAER